LPTITTMSHHIACMKFAAWQAPSNDDVGSWADRAQDGHLQVNKGGLATCLLPVMDCRGMFIILWIEGMPVKEKLGN